jgi:ABC-2 type transport system permease protein
MLASMRAELLVLRKWPAAWGLLLVTPALVLLSDYIGEFISYLNLTPADYATLGTPSQALGSLTLSQFNIIAVMQFNFSGTAPFIVLGAVMAGGDWSRGTIATSLLQRPGRARTFAGQALALVVAITGSVLATFAVAAGACYAIKAIEGNAVNPFLATLPPALVIAESVGAALFVTLTYGMVGLLLGTVCRSGAGAISVALLWTLIIEDTLYNLALDYPNGILRIISDLTPGAAATVVTGPFGDPGGGADSQNYPTMTMTQAVLTLAVYLVLAFALAVIVLKRRDAVTGPSRRRRLPRLRRIHRGLAAPASGPGRIAARLRLRPHPQPQPQIVAGGTLVSLRAELLVMSKRPAIWALVLFLPADMLLNSYFSPYLLFATANTGVSLGVSGPLVLTTMMPGHYLAAALNGAFGESVGDVYGGVAFMLLGALIGGSDWGRGTVKTAALQGPSRLRAFAGQVLSVGVAVAVSIALTFILAAVASAIVALHQTGALVPAGSPFPVFGHLAEALAAALALGLAYAAVGLTLGIWLRSATAGIGAVLLWAIVVQPSLEYFAPQLGGVMLHLYDILPNAATNTVINLDGNPNLALYGENFAIAQVAPALAFLTLGLYAAVFLAIPALITRRRDLA